MEGILNAGAIDTAARNYAFALASIEASISEEMSLKSGLMIGYKKGSDSFLNVQITIKGFTTEELSVDLKKETKATSVPTLFGSVDKKKIATISWNAASANKNYLGFIIERKTDNGKYTVLTKDPYVHLVTSSEKKDKLAQFRDENVEQGKKYTYRITGINYFGRKGAVSNEVELTIAQLVNAFVAIDSVHADNKMRVLNIHLSPESKTSAVHAAKLQVLKSTDLLTGYSVVYEQKITSADTLFIVKLPSDLETGDSFYYKAIILSADNDSAVSPPKYFFTLDQEPPKPVTNVTAKIDEKGAVTLTWEQHTDIDLIGFRIFRANTKREEFVERNNVFITTKQFNDTLPLNTLTNEVYYFVIAVDENFNTSKCSDTILVMKPDTIAPVPPMLIDLISRQAKVQLSWELSVSNDVNYHALYRTSGSVTDTLLTNNALQKGSFTDTTMIFGKEVVYQLLARDRSGNTSLSKVRSVVVEPGYRKALDNVSVKVNRDQKNITIKWDKPANPVFQYFIYRKKNDGRFELIKTLEGTNLSYVDNQLTISSKYEYYVQYQSMDGFRSLKHQPVPVKY